MAGSVKARLVACHHCGTEFETTHPQKTTCNKQCMHASWNARNQDKLAEYRERQRIKQASRPKVIRPAPHCEKCGCRIDGHWQRRVCDPCKKAKLRLMSLCSSMRKHDDAPRQCQECLRNFVPTYGSKRRVYCSELCRRRSAARVRRKKEKARLRAATVESVNPVRVFMRDGWRCHLCGGMTDQDKRGTLHPNAPELDHIIPLSKGGPHSYANTACAHKRCNAAKSDKIIGQPSLLAA